MGRVLLVDDEENNLNAMRRLLRAETDFEVETCASGAEGLECARKTDFDVVVADYRMPGMDGACFLEEFQRLRPDAYRMIASAFSDTELFRKAINQAQIHRFIQKPWDGFIFVDAISRGIEQASVLKQLASLNQEVARLSGLLESVASHYPDALPENWRDSGHR